MTSTLLIYPHFNPSRKRSSFLFPPLGLGYVASALRENGHRVDILDCTFLEVAEARRMAEASGAEVVGIYSMASMRQEAIVFARLLRRRTHLLVAGGPEPSSDPASFLDDFDLVVIGEGEETVLELLGALKEESDLGSLRGIAYRRGQGGDLVRAGEAGGGAVVVTEGRPHREDLDSIPFPARDLFPNEDYIRYWREHFGSATTSVITTRGCPFACEFCSRSVFGTSYRERSAGNVLDEVEEVLDLGYDHIHFSDDVFTLNRERVLDICRDIRKRALSFSWECLCRVDGIDPAVAEAMRVAGCQRVLFGIESGSNAVLSLMRKRITVQKAEEAVSTARSAGLKTGAFFILCYPGETDETVLQTLRFATRLPLDYLSFTAPHPLPGTPLYERVKEEMGSLDPSRKDGAIFCGGFSEGKVKFAKVKGEVEFNIRRHFGRGASLFVVPFEAVTDRIFGLMK